MYMTDATSFVTPFFELEVLRFLMNFCALMQFAFLEILESISVSRCLILRLAEYFFRSNDVGHVWLQQ